MTNAFAAANVVVNPTVTNKEKTPAKTKKYKPVPPATVTITKESLTAMIQAATQAAVEGLMAQAQASTVGAVPAAVSAVGPRKATKPEACAAHKLLSVLDQSLSKVIVGTRDYIVVPMNVWAVDHAAPRGLAVVAAGSVVVASGAAKVTGFFTRLAEKAAAKSLALTVQ
jgi:hypothetical protein